MRRSIRPSTFGARGRRGLERESEELAETMTSGLENLPVCRYCGCDEILCEEQRHRFEPIELIRDLDPDPEEVEAAGTAEDLEYLFAEA